jgi:hypothetical protein
MTNAGQANAATGTQGYEDAVQCATLAAASLGVSPDDVLLMSTGVCVCLFVCVSGGAVVMPGCARSSLKHALAWLVGLAGCLPALLLLGSLCLFGADGLVLMTLSPVLMMP